MPDQKAKLPPGYCWREGTRWDHAQIQWWLQATLQEAFPEQTHWDHLQGTIERLYDPPQTPCWWILSQSSSQVVGCVWVGTSLDQVTNQRVAYVFLLRVDPEHRRQGLGRVLIQQVESWSREQRLAGVLLQVFSHNQPALSLYTQQGFTTQGYWLHKAIPLSSSPR